MGDSPVSRVETATGHYYSRLDGQQVAGVTTILKALPKGKLESWRLRKAVSLALKGEEAWEIPTGADTVSWLIDAGEREALEAAAIGTGAHNFAEAYMLGFNPTVDTLTKAEKKHAECFLHFVRDYQPTPVLVEKVVTYIDPKTNQPLYCGTIDLVAELTAAEGLDVPDDWENGLTWLIDYKASSSTPRASHALQAAAYRYATHWIDEDGTLHPMVPVDRSAVILLNGGKSDKCYRGYELDTSPVVFSVFKSLLRIHNFSKIEDRVIIGEL